jgi:hypothetical protein
MKKALISPSESPIQYISSWEGKNQPVYSDYPNSCRVAEICETEFEIAPPLFWTDCADDIVADQFYFNTATNEILPIVNEPQPIFENQPTTDLTTA